MRLSATKLTSDFEYVRLASQLGPSNLLFCVFLHGASPSWFGILILMAFCGGILIWPELNI